MPPPFASSRNLGLDIFRTLAIGLVLLSHGLIFFFKWYYPNLREIFILLGFLGVELFFVLSGFLIGKIIIEEVLEDERWASLGRFYARRWLRTLPPYYLVVVILILTGKRVFWQNFLFLQNSSREMLEFFPVSWSLSVEEWFYLLIPFFLLLAARYGKGDRAGVFFGASLLIIAISIGVRIAWVLIRQPSWGYGVQLQPFLRMDSLMVGVAIAGVAVYRPRFYAWLAGRRIFLVALGGSGLFFLVGYQLFVALRQRTADASFYHRTFFFFLVSICAGMVLVALETSRRINEVGARRWWARIFRFGSVTSYSVYLVHGGIFGFFIAASEKTEHRRVALAWSLCALVVTLLLSFLLYRLYEKPILRLRDKMTGHRLPGREEGVV